MSISSAPSNSQSTPPSSIKFSVVLFCLGLYTFCFLTFLFGTQLDFFPPPEQSKMISSGTRVLGISVDRPADLSKGKPVVLPEDWRIEKIAETEAWYEFSIPRHLGPDTLLAFYIPTVRQNLAVYINGQRIAGGGDFDKATTRLWQHPLYIEFPSSLLSRQENSLTLRVQSHRNASVYISPLYLGEAEDVRPSWRWHYRVKIDLLRFIAHFFLIVGLLNLMIWWLRRRDTFYLWYALAALIWSGRCYLLLESDLPISHDLWAGLRLYTLGLGTVFVLLFNLRFFGYKDKVTDVLLLMYCVPLGLPVLFMSVELLHGYGHMFWARICILIAAYTSYKLIQIYQKTGDARAIALLCTGIPLFVFGFYDLLVLNDHISPQHGFIINYASPPALILAMWYMFIRFSTSLEIAENLNVTLEQRVKEREEKLEQEYEKQKVLQREQVLAVERERITRDMHDGIGGHLVRLKSILGEGATIGSLTQIRDQVEHALVDLRLVINSLDRTVQTIPEMLGSMRRRWQRCCDGRGITLSWPSEPQSTSTPSPGPRKTLQIIRILEEAFSNCLKHSSATTITLNHGPHPKGYQIRVTDDGSNPRINRDGMGHKNMQFRAKQIDADLMIDKSAAGFSVTLILNTKGKEPPTNN